MTPTILLANPRGLCAGVDRDTMKIDFDHPLTGLVIELEVEIARIL